MSKMQTKRWAMLLARFEREKKSAAASACEYREEGKRFSNRDRKFRVPPGGISDWVPCVHPKEKGRYRCRDCHREYMRKWREATGKFPIPAPLNCVQLHEYARLFGDRT